MLKIFSQIKYQKLLKEFLLEKSLVLSGLANFMAKSFFFSKFFADTKTVFFIIPDEESLRKHLVNIPYFNNLKIKTFTKDLSEKEIISNLLSNLDNNNYYYFVDYDFLKKHKVPSLSSLQSQKIIVSENQDYDMIDFINNLLDFDYQKSEENIISEGEFKVSGDLIEIRPVFSEFSYYLHFCFDKLEKITKSNQKTKLKKLEVYPAKFLDKQNLVNLKNYFKADNVVLLDELDEIVDDPKKGFEDILSPLLLVSSFPRENEKFKHFRYLSVLQFFSLTDFFNDLRNKISDKWQTIIYTKRKDEIIKLFQENNIPFSEDINKKSYITILKASKTESLPESFQNPEEKIAFITDKEIFTLKKSQRNQSLNKMNLNFISSLQEKDYVIHFDHGIGVFNGITKRTIENITREYLEIEFAQNDRLFVPVENADKLSKYINNSDDINIKLNKLGGAEWQKQIKKAKKESEKLAKELLEIYAKREQVKRPSFLYSQEEDLFAEKFPYDETPGQLSAIMDVKKDMEKPEPMDRLICGDVGFGKTEVAMRAAFKAVKNGKQVAFVSPITILTEQHYQSFKKRMKGFNIRIEMLSRFRSQSEQKEIIKKMKAGKIDIVIGTHRLLQKDINFNNLGLVIIDEEQRFGVKQKEALKKLRSQVDILTLTATPIPRTLNLSLNKLRNITTITTPPPSRLPIITEVRKFSNALIRSAILKELDRGGQIYFLHNRVETIESIAYKLRELVPEAKMIVAHGQMTSKELESRIRDFKQQKYDVLISSTIIENGIDLANANTMLINNAEKFGLSQLYQLRGRIGRSTKQAYAYLLYHSQKLNLDAKKRLRALVEASDLGAGFQIAMRDLEIRGAGEILGSAQHGAMKSIGISHFLRMLHKTIKEMQNNTYQKESFKGSETVSIDLPVDAFIPDFYITNSTEKMALYQKLASVNDLELLEEFKQDVKDEYGKIPLQVKKLFLILELKYYAKMAGIYKIHTKNLDYQRKEIVCFVNNNCTPEMIFKVIEKNPNWKIQGNSLSIDLKNLGMMFLEELINTIKTMAFAKKKH
jgi:transcription-repair coupling factor